jgi:glycerol-3-phosphate acyltransferase PlsY
VIATALAFAVASFLIGSIPFGYVIGRFFYRTDIRTQGSGNIGAMNALRTLGKKGAAAVLLLDAAKGFAPAFAADFWAHSHVLAALAAACAIAGHCFSPWLGWKGGKGVATSFGAIFALSWQAGIVAILAWALGALALTQYSSVGSMLANIVAPFALWFFTQSIPEVLYGVFAAALIVWSHRENLQRLRAGTENRIGLFSKK